MSNAVHFALGVARDVNLRIITEEDQVIIWKHSCNRLEEANQIVTIEGSLLLAKELYGTFFHGDKTHHYDQVALWKSAGLW